MLGIRRTANGPGARDVTDIPKMLPAAIMLGAHSSGVLMRISRSAMLEVLRNDYVRTAHAKGLPPRRVVYSHAGRNAVMPLVTMIALDLPTVFAGALFIETIFSWPGMGRLFWEAARGRDYPVLMGIIMINAILIIVANIIADIVYARLDPRVRYE